MDDESKYGEVFFRMGFGQAVSRDILTDYKVMVLAVDEAAIQKICNGRSLIQKMD